MENCFPTIPPDRGDDIHYVEYAGSADLVLFMVGNQFMAMEEIMYLASTASQSYVR